MVLICDKPYTNTNFNEYFEKYTFELSDFQKYAIEAIVTNNHALVTAHTGSGKTLPAEFAIDFFNKKGKKLVYTSPIKALSNQKYYDFCRKFPNISFGIFTGDIKINPNADVLIMTTEILMNYLFCMGKEIDKENIQSNYDFQLNIQDELGCVVFDEVHYINDAERGQNWEKTILMLPPQVQMVMLSATIDAPEKFAKWCERDNSDKQVYLSGTHTRVVPLTHYGYLTTNEGVFKKIKDKETQQKIRSNTNKFIALKSSNDKFIEEGYLQLKSSMDLFDKNNLFMNKTHVLNNVVKQLCDDEMLPAIVFVFSRKNVESYAKAISVNILEFDSKVPYTIKYECDAILKKLPNYKEYMQLPEYETLIKLLEKGIAIHHSGMIPVFRELVENMISQGHVKLLFATESFAIGLDCPIRTAVFSSLSKFDGSNMRYLFSHEYNQAAGRAGRRGLDRVGHVVHCNNMFSFPSSIEYKDILCGKPQQLISKFYISFSTILSLVKNGRTNISDFIDFVDKSMLKSELEKAITNEKQVNQRLMDDFNKKNEFIGNLRTDKELCEKYLTIETQLSGLPNENGIFTKLSNKQRKELERQLQGLKVQKFLLNDVEEWKKFKTMQKDLDDSNSYIYSCENFINIKTQNMCDLLCERGFLINNDDVYTFTPLGEKASNISETHSLIVTEFLENSNYLEELDEREIVGLISIFTDIKVCEEKRSSIPKTENGALRRFIKDIMDRFETYARLENTYDIHSGYNYDTGLMMDMIDPMISWCDLEDTQQCKYFIHSVLNELEVGLGDFSKGVLKISAIVKEWVFLCETFGFNELYHKLIKIDEKILKFVATTQSLYI